MFFINIFNIFATNKQLNYEQCYFSNCLHHLEKQCNIKKAVEENKYPQQLYEIYLKLLANVKDGLVFSRDGDKIWKCRNCGHIVIGKAAPEICPVCAHPKAYFEIKAENY